MSAVLDDLPKIDAGALTPASQQLPAHALETINSLALSHFDGMEPDLRALAERYRGVAFDVSTAKGLADAKKARHELRESGRFAVQRAEKQIKDCANDLKRVIAPKVEQLVAIVQPVEDHVDAQIKAHEEKVAREKAEREAADAARRKKHTDNIATLSGFIERAAGRTAAEIAKGIAYVEKVSTHPDAFEEFSEEATATKARVLAALKAMHSKAQADEAERERLLAQLAAAQSNGAAQAPRERSDDAGPAAANPTKSDATPEAAPPTEGLQPGMTIVSPQAGTLVLNTNSGSMRVIEAPPDSNAPPINITEITRRLGGILLTRKFIEGTLGITASHTEKTSVLWPASAFEAIKAALIAHVQGCR